MKARQILSTTRAIAVATALMMGAATSASAAIITFDFTGGPSSSGSDGAGVNDGNANTYNSTPGGYTVTATAWSYYNGQFYDARLGNFEGNGLGVCNEFEQPSCSSPNHQVDNQGTASYDFVLFVFSAPVMFTGTDHVRIRTTDDDDLDVSWFAGTPTLPANSLAGKSFADLGLAPFNMGSIQTNDCSSCDVTSRNVSLATGNITALLFGAKYGDNNDAFKIKSMQVDPNDVPPPAVPEPTSMMLLGTGLVFGARTLRRRATPNA